MTSRLCESNIRLSQCVRHSDVGSARDNMAPVCRLGLALVVFAVLLQGSDALKCVQCNYFKESWCTEFDNITAPLENQVTCERGFRKCYKFVWRDSSDRVFVERGCGVQDYDCPITITTPSPLGVWHHTRGCTTCDFMDLCNGGNHGNRVAVALTTYVMIALIYLL